MQTGNFIGWPSAIPQVIDNVQSAYLVSRQPVDVCGFVYKSVQGTPSAYGRGVAFQVLRAADSGDATDQGVLGSSLFQVTANGSIGLAGNLHLAIGLRQPSGYASSYAIYIQPYIDTTHLISNTFATQSVNVVTITNSVGTTLMAIGNTGNVNAPYLADPTNTGPYVNMTVGYVVLGDRMVSGNEAIALLTLNGVSTRTGPTLDVSPGNAAAIGVRITAAAAATAKVQEWRASGPTTVAAVSAAGAVLSGSGTVSLPGQSFLAVPDMGFYTNSGVLGVAVGGALIAYFSSTGFNIAGKNITTDTTTGTKIATAITEKVAFHNSTPVVQRAGAAQVAVAVTGATSTTPFGYTTAAQANAIVSLLNEIRGVLVEKGLMKGAA